MTYQSEAELEKQLLSKLQTQGYTFIKMNDYKDLEDNFRIQLNLLNRNILDGKDLSDKEFERVLTYLNGKTVYQSAKQLRDQFILDRDDGTQVYLYFLDETPENNTYQVTNQVTVQGKYVNRYDVTILVNGLPLVQIELKRRGIDINRAIDQIDRYRLHSFKELFKYIQIFVVSNGVETRYFANTNEARILKSLTFYWTKEDNERINILDNFSSAFLERNKLLKMLMKYMVINDTDKNLIVMRPYQVYATEALIRQALNTNSNGYIWHTTGSGKTLTSWKCANLLKKEPSISKVFFLIDRKDLDTQTIEEFNKFEKDCVNNTDDTKVLVEQMGNPNKKLIVTTIQKMAKALNTPRYQDTMDKFKDCKVVFIIDECHRSQFGEMHTQIKRHFQKAQYAQNKTRQFHTQFPFNETIFCAKCGCQLTGELKKKKSKNGTKEYIYYHCTGNRGGDCKKGSYIRQEIIDEAFTNILKYITIPESVHELVIKGLKEVHEQHNQDFEQQKKSIRKRIDKIDKTLKSVFEHGFDNHDEGMLKNIEEWKIERRTLMLEEHELLKATETFFLQSNSLLEFCKDAHRAFLEGNAEQKRKIVKIVCSNFSYDGETLDIVPNPVFKVIIKNNLSNKKLPRLDSNQQPTG